MNFPGLIMLLLALAVFVGICWLIYWAINQLPLNPALKGVILCILALIAALVLGEYFFNGPGLAKFGLKF